MKTPKLFQLLRILDDAEFKRLYKFLRSPFFNYTPSVVKYYELIRRDYPDFDAPRLAPERLWKKLFPEKPFHELKYWQLSAKFTTLVKKYITFLELEHQEGTTDRLYVKALGRRNSYAMFEKETFDLIKSLDKQPYRDEQYYTQQAALLTDYFFHTLTPKRNLKDETLLQAVESTDRAFVLTKLRQSLELKAREKILNTTYKIRLLDGVMSYVNEPEQADILPIELYRLLHDLFGQADGEEYFFKLKEKLVERIDDLRKIDQYLITYYLINYAIAQLNKGEQKFYKEAFELYQMALDIHLLIVEKKIEEAIFSNIVALACSSNEIVWAKGFVKEYSPYLEEEIRLDTVNYSQAYIANCEGENVKAIHLLTTHNFSGFAQIKSRLLTCRSAYEAFLQSPDYGEFLLSQIDSFEKYLQRKEFLTDSRKKNCLNYLKYLRKLHKLHGINEDREKKCQQLEASIRKKKILFARNWLLAKLSDIRKKTHSG